MSASSSVIASEQVRSAHADAWEALGRASVAAGGGWSRLAGVRLMATGLPHPQWNNGDVIDPRAVDIDEVAAWYAELGVPWGVRVPAGAVWPHGRKLFEKRLMAMSTESPGPGPHVEGLAIRDATPGDAEEVVHVDATAFGEPPALERPWVELLLGAPSTTVALAELNGEPVGTAYTVTTEGEAGPALYLAGVAVLPAARRRGIAGALSSWLLRDGTGSGPRLAHLHPDTDGAARVYARLGFVEVAGLDIYVDNDRRSAGGVVPERQGPTPIR